MQLSNKNEQNNYSDIKPIWEMDSHFKCPVIGAFLSEEELKKILKKAGNTFMILKWLANHEHERNGLKLLMSFTTQLLDDLTI